MITCDDWIHRGRARTSPTRSSTCQQWQAASSRYPNCLVVLITTACRPLMVSSMCWCQTGGGLLFPQACPTHHSQAFQGDLIK